MTSEVKNYISMILALHIEIKYILQDIVDFFNFLYILGSIYVYKLLN